MKKHQVVYNGEVVTDTDSLDIANKIYGTLAASVMQEGKQGTFTIQIRNRIAEGYGDYDYVEISRTNGKIQVPVEDKAAERPGVDKESFEKAFKPKREKTPPSER